MVSQEVRTLLRTARALLRRGKDARVREILDTVAELEPDNAELAQLRAEFSGAGAKPKKPVVTNSDVRTDAHSTLAEPAVRTPTPAVDPPQPSPPIPSPAEVAPLAAPEPPEDLVAAAAPLPPPIADDAPIPITPETLGLSGGDDFSDPFSGGPIGRGGKGVGEGSLVERQVPGAKRANPKAKTPPILLHEGLKKEDGAKKKKKGQPILLTQRVDGNDRATSETAKRAEPEDTPSDLKGMVGGQSIQAVSLGQKPRTGRVRSASRRDGWSNVRYKPVVAVLLAGAIVATIYLKFGTTSSDLITHAMCLDGVPADLAMCIREAPGARHMANDGTAWGVRAQAIEQRIYRPRDDVAIPEAFRNETASTVERLAWAEWALGRGSIVEAEAALSGLDEGEADPYRSRRLHAELLYLRGEDQKAFAMMKEAARAQADPIAAHLLSRWTVFDRGRALEVQAVVDDVTKSHLGHPLLGFERAFLSWWAAPPRPFDGVHLPPLVAYDAQEGLHALAAYTSALAELEVGRTRDAERLLREALSLAPHRFPMRVALAALLRQQGRLEEAWDVLDAAMVEAGTPTQVLVEAGIGTWLTHRVDRLDTLVARAQSSGVKAREVLAGIASLMGQSGLAGCRSFEGTAHLSQPGVIDALHALCRARFRRRDAVTLVDGAIGVCEEQLGVMHPQVGFVSAIRLVTRARLGKGVRSERLPGSPLEAAFLGLAHTEAGDLGGGFEEIARGIEGCHGALMPIVWWLETVGKSEDTVAAHQAQVLVALQIVARWAPESRKTIEKQRFLARVKTE